MICAPSKHSDQPGLPPSLIRVFAVPRKLGSLATHWAHSEDSDQTGWICHVAAHLCFSVCFFHPYLTRHYLLPVMHQSFVVPAPMGPGNSGAFNFSVFKVLLNTLHWRDKSFGKIPAKSPPPPPPEVDNNEEQQMTWTIWINFLPLSQGSRCPAPNAQKNFIWPDFFSFGANVWRILFSPTFLFFSLL